MNSSKRAFAVISFLFVIFCAAAQEVITKTVTTTTVDSKGNSTTETKTETISSSANSLIPAVRVNDYINIKFGGFVRAEYYLDSREMVGAIDDLISFMPERRDPDADGKDLNDVVRQNLSMQATRFSALIGGPDFLKAKSNAYFEFDFTGGNSINIRVRQAWLKLNWDKAALLIGRTWNPMAESPFPNVVGLHTGLPFRPFGRAEQIRLTLNPIKNVTFLFAGVFPSEHKYKVDDNQSGDLRANPYPDLHFQIRYASNFFSAGLMSEYKCIRPTTKTTGTLGTFKSTKTISTYALGAYMNMNISLFNINGGTVYGQNLSELFMQGGYAVRTLNPETGAMTYTPSNLSSSWLNINYGKTWVVGIFAGYQKNLGFCANPYADGTFYGRWQDVDYLYRVSPSIKYNYKQWCFQAELDYDVAGYGTGINTKNNGIDYNDKGKVKNAEETSAFRFCFATTFYY